MLDSVVTLLGETAEAFLLPEGSYAGSFERGGDNPDLFAGVYD